MKSEAPAFMNTVEARGSGKVMPLRTIEDLSNAGGIGSNISILYAAASGTEAKGSSVEGGTFTQSFIKCARKGVKISSLLDDITNDIAVVGGTQVPKPGGPGITDSSLQTWSFTALPPMSLSKRRPTKTSLSRRETGNSQLYPTRAYTPRKPFSIFSPVQDEFPALITEQQA